MSDSIGILTTPLSIALTHDEWSKTGTMRRSRTMTWRESWWLDGARGQSTGPTLSYFCSCCEIGERASAISCNHKGGIMGWNPDKLGEVASYSTNTFSGLFRNNSHFEVYRNIYWDPKKYETFPYTVYTENICNTMITNLRRQRLFFNLLSLLINGKALYNS